MHVDQTGTSSVQKQIDGLRLSHATITSECQGVGTVYADFVAAAHQGLELGDDARAPGPRLLHLCHLGFEKPLVNRCHSPAPDVVTLPASPDSRDLRKLAFEPNR